MREGVGMVGWEREEEGMQRYPGRVKESKDMETKDTTARTAASCRSLRTKKGRALISNRTIARNLIYIGDVSRARSDFHGKPCAL